MFDPARDTWLTWEGRKRLVHGPHVGMGKDWHPNGDRLILHPDEDCLAVSDIDGEVIRQVLGPIIVSHHGSDGLWSVSDFTDDYRYIVSFDAAELRVFRLDTDVGR